MISNTIKKLRLEKNFTQKQLAAKLNIVESCYAHWEQGRTEPNIDNIKMLSKIFDVSVDYLLGLENDYGIKKYDDLIVRPNASIKLSKKEIDILDVYKQLNDTFRAQLFGYAQALLIQQKMNVIPQR